MQSAQKEINIADISKARKDFPVFQNTDVAYLDTASSAQKPQIVLDALSNVYENNYANIHRGLYQFSQVTTEAYEGVREKVATLINAPSVNEIVFTRNSTEAINLVAESWCQKYLKAGDEIIISEMEHHANIVPWQLMAKKIGFKIKIVPILDNGTIDFGALISLLSVRTKLLSFVHVSNALGSVNDARLIVRDVKNFNPEIKVLIDGSQSIVHSTIDVQGLGCDFFVFTGHKLYGPSGVGVLWGHEDLLNAMPPYQGGGDMIERVCLEEGTKFKLAPAKFEAGTPAIADVIAFGAAIDYVSGLGLENIAAYESRMFDIMMTGLRQIDGLTFYGDTQNKAPIASFTADWAHPSDIAMILDQCDVAVRTGHHCCMPLMKRFKIDGTVRASLGLYSNEEDIERFIAAMKKAKEMLS